MVRNAVAAVLASAAAALLYRSANKADDQDDRGRGGDTDNDRYHAPPSRQSVVRQAQRKAAAAAETVSKTAKKAVNKAAKKPLVKTAKAAGEEGAKAAVNAARRLSTALPTETAEIPADKPKRKARSDAGVKRGQKARAPSEPPEILDLTVFSDTEARSAVLSSATAPQPEATPASTDDEVAEARSGTSPT
jgi:hypothetical protein